MVIQIFLPSHAPVIIKDTVNNLLSATIQKRNWFVTLAIISRLTQIVTLTFLLFQIYVKKG
ncbi:hypothetical protein EER74_19620 [Salmonella enterica subsp. enterica]|uniref:Uncharacterized protein n=1 Tax=Salmonella enterica subsp. enterica serovar Crewe TaxID=2572727 RepID=A0A657I485_SALET|nr:hypothetical protein LFZ8_14190 [Salmonella enterica subsp. enterica serovar Djakarta str. S-1087]EAA8738941.1 hypothetical protein [Salmonella enterica]EBS0277846.1 hypothetical protein [Salmonella enterica subsp. enterica serovar Waycross]ECC9659588.1 hypothetical protein [Salmonella enterica subsp. enterica]MIG52885.1 hypothetical protein [Salmonella enterica subsp. enterica serovar Warragul]MMC67126.1 hypothetical protein [Salmonella enterica subsp. enterica serovar Crewe]